MGVEGGEGFPESQHMACCLLRLAFFPLLLGMLKKTVRKHVSLLSAF